MLFDVVACPVLHGSLRHRGHRRPIWQLFPSRVPEKHTYPREQPRPRGLGEERRALARLIARRSTHRAQLSAGTPATLSDCARARTSRSWWRSLGVLFGALMVAWMRWRRWRGRGSRRLGGGGDPADGRYVIEDIDEDCDGVEGLRAGAILKC